MSSFLKYKIFINIFDGFRQCSSPPLARMSASHDEKTLAISVGYPPYVGCEEMAF
jgi:hypothetical protein